MSGSNWGFGGCGWSSVVTVVWAGTTSWISAKCGAVVGDGSVDVFNGQV